MAFSNTDSIVAADLNNMLRGLHRDNTTNSHTGDTVKTTLNSVSVTGGTIGATGLLYVIATGTSTGTAGTKTVSITFGGTDLSEVILIPQANTDNWKLEAWIRNTATNAQRTTITGMRSPDTGGTATVSGDFINTETLDTTANLTLAITGELSNGGDTITISTFEVYVVQIS